MDNAEMATERQPVNRGSNGPADGALNIRIRLIGWIVISEF
jgi:hypothetical protein